MSDMYMYNIIIKTLKYCSFYFSNKIHYKKISTNFYGFHFKLTYSLSAHKKGKKSINISKNKTHT